MKVVKLLIAGAILIALEVWWISGWDTPEQSAAIAAKAAAQEASEDTFKTTCLAAIQSRLSMPATFNPSYFMAGLPQQTAATDKHATSWVWYVPFEASNAYGAVGKYEGICTQREDGVYTRIRLAAN